MVNPSRAPSLTSLTNMLQQKGRERDRKEHNQTERQRQAMGWKAQG